MFKAAFPWAKVAEENAERDYIKVLPSTAHDEVAGNVWVNERHGTFNLPITQHAILTKQSHQISGRVWHISVDCSSSGRDSHTSNH